MTTHSQTEHRNVTNNFLPHRGNVHDPNPNKDHKSDTSENYVNQQQKIHQPSTGKQQLNKSEIAKKAAETRIANDPDAFKKMGSKGGKARHEDREKDHEDD